VTPLLAAGVLRSPSASSSSRSSRVWVAGALFGTGWQGISENMAAAAAPCARLGGKSGQDGRDGGEGSSFKDVKRLGEPGVGEPGEGDSEKPGADGKGDGKRAGEPGVNPSPAKKKSTSQGARLMQVESEMPAQVLSAQELRNETGGLLAVSEIRFVDDKLEELGKTREPRKTTSDEGCVSLQSHPPPDRQPPMTHGDDLYWWHPRCATGTARLLTACETRLV
jgi:hypothetical protein